jgi:hypothetical protein
VLTRNLLVFLLAIQGIPVTFTIVPKYGNSYGIKFQKEYRNNIFSFQEGNIVIEDAVSV